MCCKSVCYENKYVQCAENEQDKENSINIAMYKHVQNI